MLQILQSTKRTTPLLSSLLVMLIYAETDPCHTTQNHSFSFFHYCRKLEHMQLELSVLPPRCVDQPPSL